MLYWIAIFSAVTLLAAGFGLETTRMIAMSAAVVLSCLFLLRWTFSLAQRALQS